MRSIKQFDDATIEELFGADDAENEKDDRFKEYFYYNQAFSNLDNDLPIRLLVGHKGIGKSALIKRAYLNDKERQRLAVRLQPNDILGSKADAPIGDFNLLVERWKDGLLAVVASKVIEELTQEQVSKAELRGLGQKVSKFLPLVAQLITARASSIANESDRAIIDAFASSRVINVYIDDIDRGWSASEADIRNISALLNAIRDISGSDQRIRFRIGLRTDVYFLVRTSDESTDKIERHVVWLNWSNHEILCIIAKRIQTYFGDPIEQTPLPKMTQAAITESILSKVIDTRFQGNGHWSNRLIHHVLLSLTRRRPRDLVKLMHGAARIAYQEGHNKILARDLEKSFERYSGERLQDIVNEFKTELPNIERLVLGFKPSRRARRTSEHYLFTTDSLVTKLRQIMQNASLQFRNGKQVTPRGLIQFLYKIDFVTARKDVDGRIERKHFDQNRFLASEIAEFGYDWELHPAYRWALQPHDVNRILDNIFPE